MLQSKLFTKTLRQAPKDEASINAQFLMRAGFVDKQMAGVYTYLPLGLRVLNKIKNIIREEINAVGGQEVFMPAITGVANYITTGRDKMDMLYKITARDGAELFLNPTHEEIVTPLVQKHVFSYTDLPQAVYQIQDKFRDEARAKSGILRGREFSMKDLYSFHASEEDLNEYYEKVKIAYKRIYERVGLGDLTVLTYASGGVFCKYSHEFQTICDVGEDTIYVCEKCRTAVNKEIIDEQNLCPECGNTNLVEKRGIEVGNIFKLRNKYTLPFKFNYVDESGKEQTVEMGCYGMGPSRIMGTVVEVSHDEKGMIWPGEISPFAVHLISLSQDEEVLKTARDLYDKLVSKNVEVLWDDRDVSAGEKFADADLIGICKRVVVSKKTLAQNLVEIKNRANKDCELVDVEEFKKGI